MSTLRDLLDRVRRAGDDRGGGTRRWLSGVLAGGALVAAITAVIALIEPHVPVLSLAVLYLFAVLPLAVFWGLTLAIAASVASMLAFNFFFLPPTHTFTLQDSRNWGALGVFVVTSVVVSELAARSRRRATEAALLAEIAGSLLERGDVTGELERIAAEAADALQVERATIELEPDDPALGPDRHPLLAGGRRVGTIQLVNPRPAGAAARKRVLPALAPRRRHRPAASRRGGLRGRGAAAKRRRQDRRPTRGQPRPAIPAHGDAHVRQRARTGGPRTRP